MADKFNFAQVKRNIELTKKQLPVILAKETEKAFVDNFNKSGFFDKQWQVPQRRIPGTNSYKYPKKRGLSRRTKPTLTLTGRLRRAVGTSIRVKTFELIKLVVDVPYASTHNDGFTGTISVKQHTRETKKGSVVVKGYSKSMNIAKRQFMGEHPELTKIQTAVIKKFFDKVWA